jgi:CHAT domain-containing protein
MIHPLPRSAQSKYHSWLVFCGILLLISLPLISLPLTRTLASQAQGSQDALSATIAGPGKEALQFQQLEPGKPIERGLAGGQSHYYAYQLVLAAGQYINVRVDQRGIDVVVKLFGRDGKQLAEVDSESRTQGQETLSWVAEEAGSYRLDVAAKYNNVAAGQYEIRVVEVRSATENDRALQDAVKLNTEVRRLYFAGKYDEARPLAERVLETRERVLGMEHPDVASALNSLALIYYNKNDYLKAEPLYQRALNIREKLQGLEHPTVAAYLDNLANLYNQMGDYARAETNYLRALAIMEKSLGQEHPLLLVPLNDLAALYSVRNDYAKAEPLYQRALSVAEKALGAEHPDVARALSSLANLYYELAEDQPQYYDKAELLLKRVLPILEKALGSEHLFLADPLYRLANVYIDRGEYQKAEPMLQRALAIKEKTLGPENPYIALSLNALATIHFRKGDYVNAEQLYQRALAIREKILPPEHFLIGESLYCLGALYAAKGDIARAITFLSRTNGVLESNYALQLAIGSERQKVAYLAPVSKLTNLTLTLQSEAAPNDAQALNLAFENLLLWKGRALDAMTDTISTLRRHATPDDQVLFNKLTTARSKLASFKLKETSAADPDTYRTRVKDLEDEIDELEAKLSSRSIEFRAQTQPVSLSVVQTALPANSALIEFAFYKSLDLKTEKSKSARYLAYVLTAQGQPKWVELGEAAVIDRAVDAWREALRDPNRTDVKLLARSVDEKVMRPVRSLLGETRRLLIAPDSKLNLIPFAALIDEQNQYLIERYSISYLTSGRDLLRLQSRQPSKGGPLVVANPDFGRFATIAMRTDRGTGNARAQLDPTQIFFQPLPGTEDEALAIKAILPKASVLRREQATETALKQARGPRILHIATHGFFLDNQAAAPVEDDPLRIGSPGTTAVLASAEANPYTVQFEATQEFEAAREKVNGLKTRGLNAYIVKSEVSGKGTFFRVRAGNFRTQTEAQKYGAGLQENGVVSDFFVTRYEPPQRGLMEQASSVNEPLPDLRLSKFASKVEDPLLRSGLALAGANQGKSGDDDGVLTAMEAAYLDLLGTKLVVLSACDTGVGEVKNGEGVQGLRRALVLAGSESQVMSLWPVSDEAAKDLMIPYYKALQQGEGRSEGLRQVQLRMLRGRKDQRHPFYWAAFIQSGEWANLDGQR